MPDQFRRSCVCVDELHVVSLFDDVVLGQCQCHAHIWHCQSNQQGRIIKLRRDRAFDIDQNTSKGGYQR